MKRTLLPLLAILAGAVAASGQNIIFDNFNTDEGHFGFTPSFSSTSVGEDTNSTADRVTGSSLEGIGHQRLTLIHDATTTALRIRHVSGGPPYDAANGASPLGNAGFSFTTTAGEDGWIGFYLRTTASGWQTQLNLDGPANTGAQMRGSPSVSIIGDGDWHLYEWDLDAPIWGSVPGIVNQTTGVLTNSTYTIDSIYFRDLDGSPGPTADIDLDFVARSASGSIAAMVPEPSTVALSTLGGLALAFGLIRSRARK